MDQCWVRSSTPLLWFVRVLASARLPFHSHIECMAAFNPSRFGACRAGLNIRGRVLRSVAFKSTRAAHPSRRNPCAHGCHRVLDVFIVPGTFTRLSMEVTRASAAADPQSLVSSDVLASNTVSYNGYCPRRLGLDDPESSFRRPQSQQRSQGARPPPTSVHCRSQGQSQHSHGGHHGRGACDSKILVPQLIEQQICDLIVILVVPDRLALGRAGAR